MPNVAIPDRVDAALEIGLADRSISGEDALFLMDEAPLGTLCEATSRVRNNFRGSSVRYSKKVFIPLTPHLCCDYCDLRKHDVRFETAVLVFDDPYAMTQRDQAFEDEEGWITVGP